MRAKREKILFALKLTDFQSSFKSVDFPVDSGLKPRVVPNNLGKSHAYFFLIKDNKDTLPPKKLTESHMVKEAKEDGKEWYHSEPWYRFVDPFEHLKGYKIMDYMRFTKKEEKNK